MYKLIAANTTIRTSFRAKLIQLEGGKVNSISIIENLVLSH